MVSRADITRLTRELLAQAGVTAPPVPVEDVARAAGFRLIKERLDSDLSGFYVRHQGTPTIGVNVFHAPVRQRFTIAHELGHATLEDGEGHYDREFRFRDPRSSMAIDPTEIDANAFAAELLMPADWVRERWDQRVYNMTDDDWITTTAREFGVSTQALMFRLANLGLLALPPGETTR